MKYLDENGLAHLWAKIKAQSELTEEQLNEIVDKVVEAQKMEIVDSIDKMTDITKKYVLSTDGYIYEYKTITKTIIPENKIATSKEIDNKTIFNNGTGYKTGCSINAGTGEERSDSNLSYYESSGFIEIRATDIFRIKNFRWTEPYTTYDVIVFYGEEHNYLGAFTGSSARNPLPQFLKDDGTVEACIATAETTNFTQDTMNNIRYMRLGFNTIKFDKENPANDTVLTVNEPLEAYTVSETDWFSTGLSYVPEDYGEEITDLQERITILEKSGVGEGIESYVTEEAKRVAKQVYSHQNANTFTFLAVSDSHYLEGHDNIMASNIHAGQGMDLIRKNVNVDFAVCLGDNGCGSGVEGSENRATIEKGIEEIRSFNACIDSSFRGIPNFRSVGNHDSLIYNYDFNNEDYLDASELFPLYGAYNRGAIFQEGERQRGYCYRDFEDWKLRVICMNTSDLQDLDILTTKKNTRPICVSATQAQWFARTIDLSEKEDATEWSILILSHAPLDWGAACIYLCEILQAYVEGRTSNAKTHDGVTIAYNYAGKNQATIIGNCHGHNHNFKVDYLRKLIEVDGELSKTTTEPISIKRFCIPNACFERTNERGENGLNAGSDNVYDIEYGEATSYEKVAGTEKDTSICVVTIDPVAKKIYADCYGAGYDREISYDESEG